MLISAASLLLLVLGQISGGFGQVDNRIFPATFKIGVATAAYQVEGGWDEDGKGENIWDRLVHTTPELIDDRSSGDIACDAYHKVDEDIALLKELGVDYYRFSLAWSRVLPTGYADQVNQAGVDYYNTILDKLKDAGIEAMVTLYHWDLPQNLEDLGGWPSEKIIEPFAAWSRTAFRLFGDRVQTWTTFNEPHIICQQGYESGQKAPAIHDAGVLLYMCGHNLLKSHYRAYHIYNDEFRDIQKGRIGIVLNSDWYEPASDSQQDQDAAERKRQFYFGWFANPIVHGDYPQTMIDRIADRSSREGFEVSRLPVFTDKDKSLIKGSYDYIGLNTYTTTLVQWANDAAIGDPSSDKDTSVNTFRDSSWPGSASSWLKIVPWGIRSITNWIKNTYNNPDIVITENGVSDRGELDDTTRSDYYRDYLSNLLKGIYDDGSNVTHYTAWSFMDNFEWFRGYTEKFGLYHVDFESANRTRTPKQSVTYFKKVTSTSAAGTELNTAKFPDDFKFGVATAAHQTEGAWNKDGKGENIWDRWTHDHPEKIAGKANADVACDAYHRPKKDVQLVKNLGVDFYRFSISWSRILPDGLANNVNLKGIQYYNTLIDELIANNITPMITLYHKDLPQKLQDYGGWANPHLEYFFEDYAKVAFENFADRVKYWITFNEPWSTCAHGYGGNLMAPGLDLKGVAEYLCGHTILKAHARAYHLFKSKYDGQISIALSAPWFEPATTSEADAEAAERMRQFYMGWFANPIYVNGDYPEVMKENIAERSMKENFARSRLPVFTDDEKESIKGTSDFFAFNTFTTMHIRDDEGAAIRDPSWFKDTKVGFIYKKGLPGSASMWLKVEPLGFKKFLKWIKQTYGDVDIYVTENGYSDQSGELEDVDRIIYHELYLSALLDAIDEGVNVKAYSFWTLMDNFEWTEGYEHAFGLYFVDFKDPKLPRKPKKSVEVVKKIIADRRLPAETPRAGSKYIFKDEL